MNNIKEICLSEDSCCGGPRAARVLIENERITITDRNGNIKLLSIEGWERLKDTLINNRSLPSYMTSSLCLHQAELNQLILFVQDESNILPSRIYTY